MFILFDLIVNIQDFARSASAAGDGAASSTTWTVVADMFDYYLYQFPVIFQQVAGIIPLMAAGFTMIRMTRHNELTAMLASGVSLYRVASRPDHSGLHGAFSHPCAESGIRHFPAARDRKASP